MPCELHEQPLLGLLEALGEALGEALLALLDARQQGPTPHFQLDLGRQRRDGLLDLLPELPLDLPKGFQQLATRDRGSTCPWSPSSLRLPEVERKARASHHALRGSAGPVRGGPRPSFGFPQLRLLSRWGDQEEATDELSMRMHALPVQQDACPRAAT